jgi:uncharacterized membrane protein YeaQ/YmgE (transglycosylase-associated protein family)
MKFLSRLLLVLCLVAVLAGIWVTDHTAQLVATGIILGIVGAFMAAHVWTQEKAKPAAQRFMDEVRAPVPPVPGAAISRRQVDEIRKRGAL